VDSNSIRAAFDSAFLNALTPLEFVRHVSSEVDDDDSQRSLEATVLFNGNEITLSGQGNGPVDAFVQAITKTFGVDFRIVDYHQHATGVGADAQSACYFEIQAGKGETRYGAALHSNIVSASLIAVCSAFNRASKDQLLSPKHQN